MTDLFRVLVLNEDGSDGDSHMRATQTEAFQDATAFRKLGYASRVYKVTLKKLPLKVLLSHLFNQQGEEFTLEETLVKETKGVKHVKAADAGETAEESGD